MKKILLTILGLLLVGTLMLSGCTETEYVTITDTTTATTTQPAVTITETTTITTSENSQYSSIVYDAIIAYVMRELEAKGLADSVAGFVYAGDHMELLFYNEANEEIVEFVQASIDEIAPPGLPLVVYENVTFVEE